MINYLQGCFNNTPIGMLPTIINHNNQAIEDEFNWIFDSSLNRLTKSVYVPTGSVTAHNGEFINLQTEFITVKNIDSLVQNVMPKILESIDDDKLTNQISNGIKNYFSDSKNQLNHNSLTGRFYTNPIGSFSYAHDAEFIYAKSGGNVQKKLDQLDISINDIDKKVVSNDSSIKIIYNIYIPNIYDRLDEITDTSNIQRKFDDIDASISDQKLFIRNVSANVDNKLNIINTSINNINDSFNNFSSRISELESANKLRFVKIEEESESFGRCGVNMYEYNVLQFSILNNAELVIKLRNTTSESLYEEYNTLKKYYIKIQNFTGHIKFVNAYDEKLEPIIDNYLDDIREIECFKEYCYEFEITENVNQNEEIRQVLVHIKKYKIE